MQWGKSNEDKSRASRSRKSSKSVIVKLKKKINKTINPLEAKIDELVDEESNLSSSDSKYRREQTEILQWA